MRAGPLKQLDPSAQPRSSATRRRRRRHRRDVRLRMAPRPGERRVNVDIARVKTADEVRGLAGRVGELMSGAYALLAGMHQSRQPRSRALPLLAAAARATGSPQPQALPAPALPHLARPACAGRCGV